VIEAQKYEFGGEVPTKGGRFGGRSHKNGGTRFLFGGVPYEAEVDELAIINKRSATKRDRLSVSGTPKEIASALNAYGGGVNFAPGAKLSRFDYGGSLGAGLRAPNFSPIIHTTSGDNQAMNAFISQATASIAGLNARFDNLRVVLDPNEVTRRQDQQSQYNKVAVL
jgi:hypothetical protein